MGGSPQEEMNEKRRIDHRLRLLSDFLFIPTALIVLEAKRCLAKK
tara:strand:- start:12373 stop:12507 length:135 start_codon:yes stop_codon:yes gene_type:complete